MYKKFYTTFAIIFFLIGLVFFIIAAFNHLPLSMIVSAVLGIGLPIAVYFDYIKATK